jgi:aspartyl-tRNA(Asn)/glutamyl-tRNA(Gln) amidotransferase subunit A
MTALTDLSLTEMQRGLQDGSFSSRDLVQAALDRIAALEPRLHAFLHVASAAALQRADESDAARKQGSKAPLLGIPLAIKDVLTVEGLPCTCGSRILEGFVPPFSATAVRRLLDAGMVVLGKTNTDEFAMGSSTENSAYGVTHNPWDTRRVPGGSSGGSAAAVAAHYVPAALGTDTGGSVRQPAALCGVTGLKTTYGRVSRYGLVAFGSSLDTVGAFGRSAQDVSAVFSAMAGRDARDATTVDVAVPAVALDSMDSEKPLRGLRLGVPREYFPGGIQPEVEQGVREAVKVMMDLGAEVLEVSLPHTEYALPVYYIIAPAEASANLARFDGVRYGPREAADDMWEVYYRTRGRRFGPEVTRRIMIGTYALSAGYYDAYYGQAQRVRTLIRRDFEAAFQHVDLIAAPTTPGTAFEIGAHAGDPLAMYLEDALTLPANLAGIPGVSLAAGFDRQKLPIGLQLLGPQFREDLLLQTAHAFQQVTDWHTRSPAL